MKRKWNYVKMNCDGKCKSVMLFFTSVANTGRDIDRQKFCKYGWDNLFRKSSVKEYRGENLLVNISDRNKIVIEIYLKPERAKK